MGIWHKRYTPLANYIGLLFLCLIPNFSFTQTFQETVDSLKQQLSSVNKAEAYADLLNEISYTNRRISGDSTLKYGRLAQKAAIKIDYIKGQSIAHKNMGIGHYKITSPKDSMVYHYEKAIQLAEQINDYYTQAACYNNLALLFSYRERPYTVIQYYLTGIEIFDTHIKEEKSLKALMLANLAQFHGALEEYDKALLYMERAYDIARRNNYEYILSIYADDYGRILIKKNQYEKAINIFEEGLIFNEKLMDKSSKVWNWSYQADLAIAQGNCEKAKALAMLAYDYAIQEKMLESVNYNKLTLAKVALCKKDYLEVIKHGKEIIKNGESPNEDFVIKTLNIKQEARKLVVQAMETQNELANAYVYLKAYHAINDSILQKQKLTQAIEFEAKYQSKEKEKAIVYLQREQDITNRFINRLWSFLGIIVLAVLYILYLWYQRKKASQLIKTKNQELEKYIASNLQLENFAFIASHDLRTPLSNMTNFAQLLKKTTRDRLDNTEIRYLDFIDDGAKNMTLLLDDILQYSILLKSEIKKEKIYVEEFVQEVLKSKEDLISKHQVEIVTELETLFVLGDRSKLSQLLQNLLANAIKYRKPSEAPKVIISAFANRRNAIFSVEDNGIGIEETYFNKIFLLFKRLHNKKEYQGTGIGLAICKKVIDMHNGKIWVESVLGKGATFSFSLPK